jgi:prevent-host-death family protein
MATYTLSEGRPIFGELVRRASHSREHITITDRGHPAAMIISAAEYEAMASAIEDLEDQLALARHRAREAAGDDSGRVSAAEARRILGIGADQA